RAIAYGSKIAAAMDVRARTRVAGVISATATRMNRYGTPQITDIRPKRTRPRRVIETPSSNRVGSRRHGRDLRRCRRAGSIVSSIRLVSFRATMTTSERPMTFDLDRFIDAQSHVYDDVLEELRRGRKTGHWIWFIFPQIAGLGRSATSERFSVASLDEARAYLAHP